MLHTTLNLIRQHEPCQPEFGVFVKSLRKECPLCTARIKHLQSNCQHKPYGDDDPIPFDVMLKHTEFKNVLWSFQAVMPGEEQERDSIGRLLVCDCVERVLPIYHKFDPDDETLEIVIYVSRCYAYGGATDDELAMAEAAVRAVRTEAAAGATAAVRVAARAVAAAAAWAAVRAATAADAAVRVAAADEREWQTKRLMQYLNKEL